MRSTWSGLDSHAQIGSTSLQVQSSGAQHGAMSSTVPDPIGEALKMAGPATSPEQRRHDTEHLRRLHAAVSHTATAAQSSMGFLMNAAGGGVGAFLDAHRPTSPMAPGSSPMIDEGSAEAWNVWKRSNPSRRRAALLDAVGGVPLPTAAEMETLFGGAADSETPVAPRAASPRTPGRSPRAPPSSGQHSDPHALEPIVFLHGVGFGLLPYLGFVSKLLSVFKGKPMVVLEVCSANAVLSRFTLL